MDWSFRTLVRAFLVVGGLAYVAVGALQGDLATAAIGVLAVVLGAVGLYSEYGDRLR